MQLSFLTEKLHRTLLQPNADEWTSPEALEDVKAMIADLIAASNLLEVPVGVPGVGTLSVGGFEITAGPVIRLQCKVDHAPVRRSADGQPDWEWIQRLMITGIRETES